MSTAQSTVRIARAGTWVSRFWSFYIYFCSFAEKHPASDALRCRQWPVPVESRNGLECEDLVRVVLEAAEVVGAELPTRVLVLSYMVLVYKSSA